jgi:DNA repair exonuclease SbcCD ATPase subunit
MMSLIYGKDEDFDKPPKSSHMELHYSKNDTAVEYAITTASSSKYLIGLNGEDQHPHKKADAQRLLLENWTIPEALFSHTIFLRGTDKHELAQGGPASRSKWMADALDLNVVYDSLKMQVDDKISSMGKLISKRDVLEDELETVKAKMPDSKISKDKAEKAKRLLAKHRKLANKLPAKRQSLENTIKVIDEIASLPERSNSVEFYDKKLKKLRKEYLRLTVEIDKQEAAEENKRLNTKAKARMQVLDFEHGVANLSDKKHDKLTAKIKDAKAEVEAYIEAKEKYDEQKDLRDFLASFKGKEILTHDLAEAENLLSALVYRSTQHEDILSSLQSIDAKAKTCPTCGNTLTKGHVKKEVAKLEAELASLPDEVKNCKLEVRYWKAKKEKLIRKPEKPAFTSKELDAWEEQAEAYLEYHRLKDGLKPEYKSGEKNLDAQYKVCKTEMDRAERYRKEATSLEAYTKMLPEDLQEMSRDQLLAVKADYEDELDKLKETLAHSNDIVRKYSEVEIQYETQKRLISNHRSTVNRLSAEIKDIQDETKDLPAWKALAMAFGNSGVRLYQLRESAAQFSKKLTELSSLFFDSTYTFNIEVAPSKLNVFVERNGKVGSLRTLSGAETRSWSLLSAMALIRMLPSAMRCDTMFLDEIEANMNKRSRERYVRDVLPELLTIVPKIVVVSPLINGELPLQPDHDYRVVKSHKHGNWESRLVQN